MVIAYFFERKENLMAKNGPVHEIRNGVVKAAIWKNETAKGVFYNTTLERIYLKGKDWKTSGSFSRDQLLVVARMAQEANQWIYEESQRRRKQEAVADVASSDQAVANDDSSDQAAA